MSGAAADGIDDRDLPKLELLNAAFTGEIEKIDKLLRDRKVKIDSADDDDVTALHIAAAMGYNNMVLHLLDNGANIDACNQLGMTAFHYAAREGRLPVIETLLQRGINYHKKTALGVTALTLACSGSHAEVVRRLVKLPHETQRSETPKRTVAPTSLIVATWNKGVHICSYLARAGIPLDETVETLKGLTALSTAIIFCTKEDFMVPSLLDLGANPTKRGLRKKNGKELAEEFRRNDLVNLFQEKIAVRNSFEVRKDVRGDIKRDQKIAGEFGPPAQNGCTLLMYATIARSINSAKYLVSHRDVDVNVKDNLKITALQIACLLRVDELIQLLLPRNAEISAMNKFGLTAYDLFLFSSNVPDPSNLRSQLHCYRPADMKLNLSSSSSNIYKSIQSKGLISMVSSQILMTAPKTETIEPKQWLEAKIKYQPAKNRNNCKFASVEEILRDVKSARPPETNEYDMETEAMREYMEDCQSFAVSCFTDFYGEREKVSVSTDRNLWTNMPGASKYYDVAQFHSVSSYFRKEEEPRKPPIIRQRKDSIERDLRKPRTISMVEVPSQNQMRTTPRMLKKSRDPASTSTEIYSAHAGRARAPPNGIHVPTVIVRPRPIMSAVTSEAIWNQFARRGQYQLMEALQKEEIDQYSFFKLNLHEMGLYTRENQAIIEEIQGALLSGSV